VSFPAAQPRFLVRAVQDDRQTNKTKSGDDD